MTKHNKMHLRLHQVLVTVCFTHDIKLVCMQPGEEIGLKSVFERV